MRLAALILAGACLAHPDTGTCAEALGLNEAYTLAEARSESLGINREEIKTAEARYWQALSTVFPQVGFTGSQRTQNNLGGGIDSGANGLRRDSWEGRLTVSQSLFSGFREWNTAAAIKADQRGLNSTLARNRQLLYLDVSDLYHQITSLEQDQQALVEILRTLEERRNELAARVTLGRSRKGDLLASETEWADTRATLESVRGFTGAARELFAYLIGRPADSFTLTPPSGLPAADKLETYLWKTGARPDLVAAAERQTATQRRSDAVRGEFLPTIKGNFSYLALEDPEREQEWNIVVTVDVPVFDGGLRVARLSEAKSLYRASQLDFSRARRLADNEVRVAYNNFVSAAGQAVQLHEAERAALENYQAQKKDYTLGRASNLDVLSALLRWKEIIRRRIATESLAHSTMIALKVAAGEPPQAENLPPKIVKSQEPSKE
ncbi:MAG: TolC family protein [Candidatus Methylacidiphilales bacterium]|nr:TolC family protein [Candidatus Methylacidiphilales bacterium]